MAPDEKKMDLDEQVNVDMEPEDALRVLLGEQRHPAEDVHDDDGDSAEEDE